MKGIFYTCYRIVSDEYCGYEVQIKRWWCPFWLEKNKNCGVNTFKFFREAKDWINKGCPKDKNTGITVYWKRCD